MDDSVAVPDRPSTSGYGRNDCQHSVGLGTSCEARTRKEANAGPAEVPVLASSAQPETSS
jgi:hypothetical protein